MKVHLRKSCPLFSYLPLDEQTGDLWRIIQQLIPFDFEVDISGPIVNREQLTVQAFWLLGADFPLDGF